MAYFKISAKAATGKKIEAIFEKADEIVVNINAFLEKVGAERGIKYGGALAGLSAVNFSKEPDMKVWKYHTKKDGLYEPRKASKIRAEFDAIGIVKRSEVDEAVGNKNWRSSKCGFFMSTCKHWYLLNLDIEQKAGSLPVTPPRDCIEILSKEYLTFAKSAGLLK